MASVAQCLKKAELLFEHSDSARRDAEVLLCHALGKPRVYLFTWPDKDLNDTELVQFESSLARRQRGEPVAYILGEKEFWSLSLKVNPSTLIPRPDTELLVETALELLPESARSLIDLGTGTGAIALALGTERPEWSLLALDKSAEAAALAEENRQALKLENVKVLQSDWFEQVQSTGFHAVISNPPYIDPDDEHLSQGDVRFEPHSALISESEGLSDIQHIVVEAWPRLLEGGWLMLEHGYQQAPRVQELMALQGYGDIHTRKDIAGQPRITLGKKACE